MQHIRGLNNMKMWSRIKANHTYCGLCARHTLEKILSILAYISLFVAINEYFEKWCENATFWQKIIKVVFLSVCMYICLYLFYILKIFKGKKVTVLNFKEDHHLYICYGDLFQYNYLKNKKLPRKVVIPVNRFFDTAVDDRLIAQSSVHGQLFKKIYEKGSDTPETLHKKVSLQLKGCIKQRIYKKDKPQGYLNKYLIGTIAEIKDDNINYILLGLTDFDANLSASVTMEDYVLAISKLMEYCIKKSQGNPIVMPLIGGGFSKIPSPEKDILKYLIATIQLYKNQIHNDMYIVIREDAKSEITIANLKDYMEN